MIRRFRSTATDPRERGREFGEVHAAQIRATIETYHALFASRSGGSFDFLDAGTRVLNATAGFAPSLHDEMLGLADGAAVHPALIGMLNGRTEILAQCRSASKGECSVAVYVPPDDTCPVAVQTWDWYSALRGSWLVWEIPHADGRVTTTMTEYGIVGKAGVNSRGLGLLFTILHHADDGRDIGVPVHVVARAVLDHAADIPQAARLAARAGVSASSSLNLVSHDGGSSAALTVELHPGGPSLVLPDARGVLIHTNHFLAAAPAAHDTEPHDNPDTLLRYNLLQRRFAVSAGASDTTVITAMASHAGGEGAICCHPNERSPPADRFETLATVVLDVVRCTLDVHAGGPCSHRMGAAGSQARGAGANGT